MKMKAKTILEDIYGRYHKDGIQAVYLWGSILTADFNSETSDIDSIAIAEDSTDVHLENKVKDFLKKTYPEIKKFGFRLLYKSELNGGPIKSFLATVIGPQLLLLDMPDWELVAGTAFTQKDFSLSIPSYTEAIHLEVEILKRRHWTNVASLSQHDQPLLLKKLVRIVDLQQKQRGSKGSFSFSNVLRNAQGTEEKLMTAILDCKKNNWDESTFKKHAALFQAYVDQLT